MDDDGFVHAFQAKDLVVVNAKGLYNQGTSFEEIEAVKSEKEIPKKPQTRSKLKKQKEHKPVIDLHIEKLVENAGKSNLMKGLADFWWRCGTTYSSLETVIVTWDGLAIVQ